MSRSTTQMISVFNPATAEVIESLPSDDRAAVLEKAQVARAAQPAWAAQPLERRLEIMARFRAAVKENVESLARTTTRETGKPISQARNEVRGLDGRLHFFLDNVAPTLAERTVHEEPGLQERIAWEPLGVVANISAWNYPYFVGSNVFVPALLTGNAVLYKPSEHASLTGRALAELLWKAGVPPDVFQVVLGGGAAGAALVEAPINGVFFTGSHATGVRVAEAAARQLLRVQLELGGKDPVYVTDDVDLQAAAEATADGAFYNAGQSCCAIERLYVHERIYDDFVERFTKAVAAFEIGDPMDERTYIGPLTREAQLSVLEAQVADALTEGGRLRVGGKRLDRPGFYFAPTVITEVHHGMTLMREESFGPIIGIQKVRDDEAALAAMNDTPYGLTAGVYTRDRARAEAILKSMNTGSVYWNCCDRVSPRLPWSGRGHSGIGSTLSTLGIAAFAQPKAWHLRT